MTNHISPNSREAIGAIDSLTKDFFYVEGTESTGAINVNIAGSVGTSDTNLTKVGGSNITLGQKTMANSLPVSGVFKRPFIATLLVVGSSPVSISIPSKLASCALLPIDG